MTKLPTIHQTEIVAQSHLFLVEALDLEFSNGEQRTFERLASRGYGAVLIVPLLDDDTVLLIREYAAGTERYELGLPKGKVDAGETISTAKICQSRSRLYGPPYQSVTGPPSLPGQTTR